MQYNNAFEFWRDLQVQFGSDAQRVAICYLDTISAQTRRAGRDDPTELAFCKELYRLISVK